MCYVQLSLWHVPAEIIIGDTLSLKFREVYYTPSYYLGRWDVKLKTQDNFEKLKNFLKTVESSKDNEKQDEQSLVFPVESDAHGTTKTRLDEKIDKKIYVQQDLFSF